PSRPVPHHPELPSLPTRRSSDLRLSDVLTTNDDLPQLRYGLSSWTEQDTVPYVKLSTWDSLDYYTLEMYSNTEYATRKIGFSTLDRKSTRLNSSHVKISYAVFCL